MRAEQRKVRQLSVIEGHLFPAPGLVTGLALGAEGAVMGIVFLMTAAALSIGVVKAWREVTVDADQIRVRTK